MQTARTTVGRDAPGRGTSEGVTRTPGRATKIGAEPRGDRRAEVLPPGDRRVLARVREAMGRELCDRYFERVAKLSLRDGVLVVRVPSDFVSGVIDRRFGSELRSACERELGRSEFIFEVDAPAPSAAPEAAAPRPSEGKARAKRTGPAYKRFDDFLVDESNQLAYNAARAVAGGETRYSPLFIHGASGMGKTHLLQGIVDAFQKARPGARARYVTSEAFTNAFLSAMRGGTLDAFREAYRGVELLCLDDVHFLSAKRATQTELLHTFDTIDMGNKLVVLASDEHPRDIAKLHAGLSSRFIAGAVVRIDAPGPAMRRSLARAFALRRGLTLEDAAVEMIVEHGERSASLHGRALSVREIEGLVTQVEATCRLLPELAGEGGRVGALLAGRALGLDAPGAIVSVPGVRRPARIERVIEVACSALGVTLEEFGGSNRHRRIVLARSLCVLLARELTNMSYPEIARAMRRPNHSTVITAHQRVVKQIAEGELVGTGADLGATPIGMLAERLRREISRELSR